MTVIYDDVSKIEEFIHRAINALRGDIHTIVLPDKEYQAFTGNDPEDIPGEFNRLSFTTDVGTLPVYSETQYEISRKWK
jgi:hypothetical protein